MAESTATTTKSVDKRLWRRILLPFNSFLPTSSAIPTQVEADEVLSSRPRSPVQCATGLPQTKIPSSLPPESSQRSSAADLPDLSKCPPGQFRSKPFMVLGPLVEPNDEPSAIRTQWMSSLDDSTQLSQLSIPGSHNSASYNCKDEWNLRNSQLMSLLRQLDIGIRALDFRYAFHKNKITLSHYPDQGLEEVIHDLKIWLESHPSETIFVSLSPDTASSQDKNAQQLMKALLDNTANSWIKNPTTRTTLGEARGKLILLQGFPSDEPRGLDISKVQPANSPYFYLTLDSHLETVEDLDLLRGFPRDAEQQIDLKLDSVIAHLERAQKASMEGADRLHVTYTGETADGSDSQLKGDVNPRVLALGRGEFSAVNKNLAEWLNHSSKRPIGIVFMDYAGVQTGEKNDAREDGNDLIQAIINMNRFA